MSYPKLEAPVGRSLGQQYAIIDDAQSEYTSNSEVDSWETEVVARSTPRSRSNLRRKRRAWRKKLGWFRWTVDTALLLIIVGLLVEKQWKLDRPSHAYELAGDLSGFAPKFSQQIVTFTPDPVFAPEDATQFWSNETQHAWLSIVPEGLGYVNVRNPTLYNNLPHPIHDYPNHTVFTTSVTHQLHCLYTILEAFNSMKVTLSSSSKDKDPIKMPWHINHCFEYVRQAIMCAGDVALEGAATSFPGDEFGEDRGGSDGWDAKHVCKDYDQVYRYLEKETINHMKWIGSD